jgi:hypothetical protein
MPIALSGGPIVTASFVPASPADLADRLAVILGDTGAAITTVSGGYKLRLTSGQALQADLYIRDLGHRLGPSYGLTTTLQLVTTDGLISGLEQELVVDLRTRQVVAGSSQLASSLVGVKIENQGGTYIGGIPFFPLVSVCTLEVPALATTQGFWSMCDYNLGTTPRDTLIMGNSPSTPDGRVNCEALWNSDYCAAGNAIGSVRIPCLTPAPQIFQGFNLPSPVLWWNGDELRYEPFLVWGTTNGTLPAIRAQIWDALIFSKQDVMDHIQIVDGDRFVSFTDGYLYGTLNLLMGPVDHSGGNYAWCGETP